MKEISEAEFKDEISKGDVLVDFSREEGCVYCRQLLPILENVEKQVAGKVNIVKIDITSAQTVTAEQRVTAVPTLIFYRAGKEVGRLVGLKDLPAIMSLMRK